MKKITRKELCDLCLEKDLVNFYKKSPRCVSIEVPLEEVIAVVEALGIKVVDDNSSDKYWGERAKESESGEMLSVDETMEFLNRDE